jgi:hypothetical protein
MSGLATAELHLTKAELIDRALAAAGRCDPPRTVKLDADGLPLIIPYIVCAAPADSGVIAAADPIKLDAKAARAVGIAKAKESGVYKGRKATAREKAPQIRELLAKGCGWEAICAELEISRSSFYRHKPKDVGQRLAVAA